MTGRRSAEILHLDGTISDDASRIERNDGTACHRILDSQ